MTKLIKEQVLSYQKRWQTVNLIEIEELRNTTLAEKLQKTVALMAFVQAMEQKDTIDSEEVKVWERWQQLREKFHV